MRYQAHSFSSGVADAYLNLGLFAVKTQTLSSLRSSGRTVQFEALRRYYPCFNIETKGPARSLSRRHYFDPDDPLNRVNGRFTYKAVVMLDLLSLNEFKRSAMRTSDERLVQTREAVMPILNKQAARTPSLSSSIISIPFNLPFKFNGSEPPAHRTRAPNLPRIQPEPPLAIHSSGPAIPSFTLTGHRKTRLVLREPTIRPASASLCAAASSLFRSESRRCRPRIALDASRSVPQFAPLARAQIDPPPASHRSETFERKASRERPSSGLGGWAEIGALPTAPESTEAGDEDERGGERLRPTTPAKTSNFPHAERPPRSALTRSRHARPTRLDPHQARASSA
ncbi:hypothetical protein B0H15DRAFT_955642 [Mycena belliarum]|uniref:Uncharacterized protein n=1 Tax=Mycena belliarum TaxID=1033014 RepID=A0AAD6TQY9_9AGAR|nr:hypothetical protein B0H15DRAFT_955633 [Mycena belliae]KAJ7076472.1 hypothetical protein B0H15DRAFT_955639 [Mycena belliae]KAJ7076475.1 hypothetical protein B0H15DRAFT_955642 [Mycena belliae]